MLGLVKSVLLVGAVVQALLFVGFFGSPSVNAAPSSSSGSNITTSPISVDLSTSPGSSTSTTLQLQNNGIQALNIGVKLEEFKASGDNGAAQIFVPPPGDVTTQWVHFSQTSFVAQPGVWNSITMTVRVPKTAAFGYYYAVLFAPSAVIPGTSSEKIKGANAILILLNVHAPNENNALSVQSYTADKASYQYLPATFSVNVRNNGNIFTIPSGDIFISRTKNGPTIDTLDINSSQGNVLPQSNRVFQAQWTNGFPVYELKRINGQIVSDKKGKPVEQLQWNTSKISVFRWGRYYARLVLVYNNGSRDVAVNGVVSFWVIPWLLLLGLLLFLLLLGLGSWTIVRNIVKRTRSLRKRR
jgi:hypothetical protein